MMKNLFNPAEAQEILHRLQQLTPQSQRLWGTMDIAQMLAHVSKVFEMAVGDKTYTASLFSKIMGPLIKLMVMSEKPYKQNLPTGKGFVIVKEKDFYAEQEKLRHLIQRFLALGKDVENYRHALFGKLTQDEWGKSMYKHLHHHFTQFGV